MTTSDACATCGHPKNFHTEFMPQNRCAYRESYSGDALSLSVVPCDCTAYLPPRPVPEEACVCGHRKDEHGGGRCHHLNYGSGCEVHACSSCNGYTPTVPAPHAEAEAGSNWIFGTEAACRFIARTAWPWEATENRDGWAPRIGNEPDFGQKELELAYRRLDAAAEALGLRGRGERG